MAVSKRRLKLGGAALACALALLGLVSVFLAAPSTSRDWKAGLERTAYFTPQGDGRWLLSDMRAFSFDETGAAETGWQERSVSAGDLKEVWFFLEPFPGSDTFGHSYLSFVFAGQTDEVIAVSVEARMEKGENYSALRGLFRAYELSYVWSTEKDIHTRIAVNLGHRLYAYKLQLTPDQAQAILAHFIDRTNALRTRPRFYNTLFSNCTNELAKAVNAAYPNALPWHSSFILTGRSAEHLHAKGYLDQAARPFRSVKDGAEIGDAVRAGAGLAPDAFSAAWRGGLAGAP